jgi:hypothetical protein
MHISISFGYGNCLDMGWIRVWTIWMAFEIPMHARVFVLDLEFGQLDSTVHLWKPRWRQKELAVS